MWAGKIQALRQCRSRHNDFCAIRPTEQSFSQIALKPEHLGVVGNGCGGPVRGLSVPGCRALVQVRAILIVHPSSVPALRQEARRFRGLWKPRSVLSIDEHNPFQSIARSRGANLCCNLVHVRLQIDRPVPVEASGQSDRRTGDGHKRATRRSVGKPVVLESEESVRLASQRPGGQFAQTPCALHFPFVFLFLYRTGFTPQSAQFPSSRTKGLRVPGDWASRADQQRCSYDR